MNKEGGGSSFFLIKVFTQKIPQSLPFIVPFHQFIDDLLVFLSHKEYEFVLVVELCCLWIFPVYLIPHFVLCAIDLAGRNEMDFILYFIVAHVAKSFFSWGYWAAVSTYFYHEFMV